MSVEEFTVKLLKALAVAIVVGFIASLIWPESELQNYSACVLGSMIGLAEHVYKKTYL